MLFFDVARTSRTRFRLQNLTRFRLRLPGHAHVLTVLAVFVLFATAPGLAQQADTATHRKTDTATHSTKKHAGAAATHRRARSRTGSTKRRTTHRRAVHPTRKAVHHETSTHRGRAREVHTRTRRRARRHVSARELARARQLHHAFVVSSQLRPMAQQLIQERTPQAYAGVRRYAQAHTGEASAAAYMALGQAHLIDGKFKDAAEAFLEANRKGEALDDYADYLGAKANMGQQKYAAAEVLLQDFAQRHPDSVLIDHAVLLLANVKLSEGDPQDAMQQLAKLDGSSLAKSTDYLFVLAKSNQLAGNRQKAQQLYTRLYLGDPTSSEAAQVPAQLHQMGISPPFTMDENIRHAGALYVAGQYAQAAAEYQSLAQDPAVVGTAQVNDLLARAAVATFKQQKHVDPSQVARLSDTDNEAGATRLYLLMEEARDNKDAAQVKTLIAQIQQRFPTSRWTAEALYSAGNMALLVHDLPTAIQYYGDLAERFPHNFMAPLSHWHAAWLNYRLGDKKTAARLFDEQIERYPDDTHLSTAIYWRGVVYEEVEKNPAAAAACYQKLVTTFPQYYYADLARQRLAKLGAVAPSTLPILANIDAPSVPELSTEIPEGDIHVERARLLANAGLYQYIVPEISTSPDSRTWRAYAEAQLYGSDGETWRSLRIMKQKVRSYFSMPIDSIPRGYWELLFPQPYWAALESSSKKQGLDPYLVVSLVRQESEFNPKVISYANAWGLMQLLPKVGSRLAHKERVHPYRTASLLNPDLNLKLGTAYFRELMDEFNGQPEYALAAYNAGDDRVKAWLANGPYASMPEFVESIPFTQTREYVEAIMRNREVYHRLYASPSSTSVSDRGATPSSRQGGNP
ncbi:MAG: transglycosylase SLT domain-containing protein [Acidobacteriaceae bacterium]